MKEFDELNPYFDFLEQLVSSHSRHTVIGDDKIDLQALRIFKHENQLILEIGIRDSVRLLGWNYFKFLTHIKAIGVLLFV